MSKPGTIIETGTRPPARVFPTQSSVHIAGEFTRGKAGEVYVIRNLAQRDRLLGPRLAANPVVWDSIEAILALQAPSVTVSRIVGPDAERSSVDLVDANEDATMRVLAKGEGDYGDDFEVEVTVDGGSFRLIVTHDTDSTLNVTSPSFTTVTQAVNWAASLGQGGTIEIEDIGTSPLNPDAQTESLTGGDDDRGNITQDEITAARNAITDHAGPGYACAAGRTLDASQDAVIEHAWARNRVARLTAPDVDDPAEVLAKVENAREVEDHETAAVVWPSWEIRGLVDSEPRVVPGDVVLAALEARNDSAGINPAEAAAGEFGIVDHPLFLGLTREASDETLDAFAEGGVIPFKRMKDGTIRAYDSISVANPVTDPEYVDIGVGRLLMRLRAEMEPIAELYVHKKITPGRLLKLASDLEPVVKRYEDVMDGWQVEPRPLEECREAKEFLVDVLIVVAETGRTVRVTITKEGTR